MKQNLTKGEMVFRVLIGILIIVAIYSSVTISFWLLWILAAILIVSGIIRYCPLNHLIDRK